MAVVYALALAYAIYCLATNPAGPITTPDSIRYLDMWPNYPLGYGLFLKLTGERGAIVLQPILYAGALAFLGREIVRTTRHVWLAAAVLIGSMMLPQIREFHASILSESLFLSLLVVFLALAVRYVHALGWQTLIALAIVAGVATMVRRTGFAFVPVIMVMALMNRRWLTIAGLTPFVLIAGIDQIAIKVIHGDNASSLFGRHMYAKAALIEAPPGGDDHLETAYAPIRQMLASAPSQVRAVLSLYYETCLQGGCADEARAATGERTETRQTAVMGSAGLARIRQAPINFLKLTWMHYGSLWTVNRLRHPDIANDLNAFLATHRPLPYEELAMSLGPGRILEFSGSEIVRYAQYAMFAIAIFTAALALAGVVAAVTNRRLPPSLSVAAIAAMTLHSGLVLTALLAAGFTRFLLGLWPALVLALAFASYWITTKPTKEHHEAHEGI